MVVLRLLAMILARGQNSLTFTAWSQCWAPVCLMKPSGALIAAKVARSPRMSLLNSGNKWDAHLLVVCMTDLALTWPRSVVIVIQPSSSRSEISCAGVWACRFSWPDARTFRRIA